MKYLLDTHAFIWLDQNPAQLSTKAISILKAPQNTLYVSSVSIWEIQIKLQLGKLTLSTPLADIVKAQYQNQIGILGIRLSHIYALDHLPRHHNDPFDRLLIAQALITNATLISKDAQFSSYPISVIW